MAEDELRKTSPDAFGLRLRMLESSASDARGLQLRMLLLMGIF